MNPNNPNPKQPEAPNLEQELMKKKIADFEAKLVTLQEESGIVIVPIQNVTMFGTMPDLVYMPKEEHQRLIKAGGGPVEVKSN